MNRHKIIVFLTTVAILSTTIMPINVYASDDDDNNEELVTDEFVISDDRDYIPEIWAYESQPYPEDIELPRGCEFSDDSDEVIYYDNPSVDQGSMTIVIHSQEEKNIANEIMNSNTNIVDKAITLDDYGFDISCDVSYADDTYYQHDDIEESLKSDEPIGQRGIPVPETSGDYDDDIEYEEAKVSQRSNDKNTTEYNDIISNETNEKIADNNIKISSENEIISLANIISQGNSHLTKIISALLFVVKNDTSIDNPSMSDVYKLACEGLDKVSQKVKFTTLADFAMKS